MAKTSAPARPRSGKPRKQAAKRAPAKRRSTPASRRRYAVVYDIDGPRVRFGVGWFVLVIAVLVLGRPTTAVVYGVAAVAAAGQTARCWRSRKADPEPAVAALGAGAVVLLAVAGPVAAGLGVVALPVAATVSAASHQRSPAEVLTATGVTVQSSLFAAVAAASVVLLHGLEPGAAFAIVLLVSAYECGDYLVGTGASNSYEGPAAGITAALVVAFAVAAIEVPPFDGIGTGLAFGALAALLAPAGQLLASAVLPRAGSRAPALRRLDSLLLAGPVWYVALDLALV